MKRVKLGVVGIGGMGSGHLRYLSTMDTVELVGVCDIDPERANRGAEACHTTAYYRHTDLLEQSGAEAILIATPHYEHVPIAVDAFRQGVHVLCEKPITVHVNGAKKMIAAYEEAKKEHPSLLFGLMFNERTWEHHKKIKDILDGGELGCLTRVTWINTEWFRSQAYYDSGGWRATWKGEGGGILTNQCPHNLDMYNWFFGQPKEVTAFAQLGKYHEIEVEDEVTAYLEHDNGMIAHFIVTTGETPGTNRLEIVGEYGVLIYENQTLTFLRNRSSMLDYTRTTESRMGKLENWRTEIPIPLPAEGPQNHQLVTEAFVKSILTGEHHLIADYRDGLRQIMLANAMMLSSFSHSRVSLPMEGDAFEQILEDLIVQSEQ